MTAPPVFFYDVSSPYAYLAALRIDDVLPTVPIWQPIAFGALIRDIGKTPWSLVAETRVEGIEDLQGRARSRGLPELRWPPGWPAESYSLMPLRALLWARAHARLRELTIALFRVEFEEGRALDDLDTVLEAADRCGLPAGEMAAAIERPELKQELRQATSDAIALGVTGVPTVMVGDELFWGDDRLEDAAAALG